MRSMKLLLSIAFIGVGILVFPTTTHAADSPSLLLISEIETTGTNGSGDVPDEEFVRLTNISGDTLEVNNWQIDYLSASGTSVTHLATLNGIVRPNGSVLIAHTGYPGVTADVSFGSIGASALAKTGGQIRVVNGLGTVMDLVGWGSASVAAPWPKISAISSGYSVKRIIPSHPLFGMGMDYTFASGTQPMNPVGGAYEPDMCSNVDDIQLALPDGMMQSGGNCVAIPPLDVCNNLEGDQPEIPIGYGRDENGLCYIDMCLNIAGLQLEVPAHYERDQMGDCFEHDECDNISGAQFEIPENMVRKGVNDCVVDVASLQLTELLPNADGSDTDHEYIEIYNPTNKTVSLITYYLQTGVAADKIYSFPAGAVIGPGEYKAFYNDDVNFTLINTTGRVVLGAIDGTVLGDSGVYESPGDGMAWALIDGIWRYTDQPTPGVANIWSLPDDDTDVPSQSTSVLCPAGKYRNPLTNRCRNIETDASVLAACDADQYRNPETGRCRKVASAAAQTPCKEGQYRSEETNRCRNIATASAELTPCKEGQERSPETNRCRNVSAKAVPDAAFAIEPMKEGLKAFAGWWALGGVGVLAVSYAGWEWRYELMNVLRRVKYFVIRK